MNEVAIKTAVRERYARAAEEGCCGEASCCDQASMRVIPLTKGSLDVPSLGCGSPVEAAGLMPGEVVLDLGSGRGFDAFHAAGRVGPHGHIIGVDMTPEMVLRAREDAARLGFEQVEFRLGEIEHLPLPNASVDVVISNCVINLVPDKDRVFAEAHRVLRPGGRLVVSDIVERSQKLRRERLEPARWAACIEGADEEGVYLSRIRSAKFEDVEVLDTHAVGNFTADRAAGTLHSITVRARKAGDQAIIGT